MLRQYILLQSAVYSRRELLRRRHGERGATAVEYGLMVALIAVAIIVAVTTLGSNLSTMFTNVKNKIPTTVS